MSFVRSFSAAFRARYSESASGSWYRQIGPRLAAATLGAFRSIGTPPDAGIDRAGRAKKAKPQSNWNVQLAFGSAIAILLVVGAFSYRSIVASSESDLWVRHTYEVLG